MELSKYSIEEIVVSAVKAEVDARDVYDLLAQRVRNAVLKDRLRFLAGEERKHQAYLESLYLDLVPDGDLHLPDVTPVPMPTVRIPDESVAISEVLSDAMAAETAAADFYSSFALKFDAGSEHREMLEYFAEMEKLHYDILKRERENAERFEDFDVEWGMMHVGP